MRRKVHILFPSEWVAYSPTILNLVTALREDFEVFVTAFDNGKYKNSQLDPNVFNLIRIPYVIFLILVFIGGYRWLKKILLCRSAKKEKAEILIGVDNIGLEAALSCSRSAHFLSLELDKNNNFIHYNIENIISIAIQTKERLDYLFPEKKPDNTFILPNSLPFIHTERITKNLNKKKFNIIFLGNAIPAHGIFICIDAIHDTPFTKLTIKGPINSINRNKIENNYKDLIKCDRLYIDSIYINQNDLINYLRDFDAGFCFYDFNRISKDDFNYQSSPSGKMYAYFTATVPIIGSDIIGLKPAREFSAGILLKELSTKNIQKSIDDLRNNYEYYQNGCVNASKFFDFNLHVQRYKQFLLDDVPRS